MNSVHITPRYDFDSKRKSLSFSYDSQWIQLFDQRLWRTHFIFPSLTLLDSDSNFEQGDLLVLSGGNNLSSVEDLWVNRQRDLYENSLLKMAICQKVRILGVCRGAQFLYKYLGGNIVSLRDHAGFEHDIAWERPYPPLSDVKRVLSHHDYGLRPQKHVSQWEVLASDPKGHVEVFQALGGQALGLMWHPERQNEFIKKLFLTFLRSWLDESR